MAASRHFDFFLNMSNLKNSTRNEFVRSNSASLYYFEAEIEFFKKIIFFNMAAIRHLDFFEKNTGVSFTPDGSWFYMICSTQKHQERLSPKFL